jgi:glycosyltransferase involved in cell wall biosynthesis
VLDGASGPTALLVFDSYARHLRRRLDLESLPRRRLQLRVELRRSETWERRWYPQATALACVSSVDAEWLDARLPRQVDVIENPIGDGYFDPPGVTRTSDTVAFVGSLLFEPNLDAVEWLIGDIWPRVVARRPLAALVVAGRSDGDPSRLAHVRRMVESVGGEVEADVPDVRPVYWRAATAIAPIRLGAGLRNKVLHAMACGAPVVATPAAVEGLPVSADEHVLVASTADAFADAIARTLDDPAAATARAGAARMVVEQFRTPRIGARLEEWWATAVAAHSDRESRR